MQIAVNEFDFFFLSKNPKNVTLTSTINEGTKRTGFRSVKIVRCGIRNFFFLSQLPPSLRLKLNQANLKIYNKYVASD